MTGRNILIGGVVLLVLLALLVVALVHRSDGADTGKNIGLHKIKESTTEILPSGDRVTVRTLYTFSFQSKTGTEPKPGYHFSVIEAEACAGEVGNT